MERLIRERVPENMREALLGHLAAALASTDAKCSVVGTSKRLTVKQIAREVGVTEPTVRAWIASGALQAERLGRPGKRVIYRVTPEGLDAFLCGQVRKGACTTVSPKEEAARILATLNGRTNRGIL